MALKTVDGRFLEDFAGGDVPCGQYSSTTYTITVIMNTIITKCTYNYCNFTLKFHYQDNETV